MAYQYDSHIKYISKQNKLNLSLLHIAWHLSLAQEMYVL